MPEKNVTKRTAADDLAYVLVDQIDTAYTEEIVRDLSDPDLYEWLGCLGYSWSGSEWSLEKERIL
jgi:hypothetical protein